MGEEKKGQHEVGVVEMENLVEVENFEYLGPKKLKKTIPINLL